jgi:hypothetical protein
MVGGSAKSSNSSDLASVKCRNVFFTEHWMFEGETPAPMGDPRSGNWCVVVKVRTPGSA